MMGEAIRVSGTLPDVGDFLKEAMLSQKFADVALCCPGGQRFLAHRLVLSAASPYLQEVLLAHSKATEYCEPITVILAEIEGPELAAILSFVYTGSTTVPRPHLDAFLRAAEALHIRLPPLPVLATGCLPDCKTEDAAPDVQIHAKYQYPSWKGCYVTGDESSACIGTYEGFTENAYSSAMPYSSPVPIKLHGDALRVNDKTFKEPSNWSLTERTMCLTRGQKFDACSLNGGSPYSPTLTKCLKDVNTANQFLGPISNDERFAADKRNTSDLRNDLQGHLCRSNDHGLNRAVAEYAGSNDLPIGARRKGIGFLEQSSILSPCCATTVDQRSAHAGVVDRPGMQEIGENLTCKDNCCRWITPRRHVANQVTASPWKQVVRPHHSPKELHETCRVPSPAEPGRQLPASPRSPAASESAKIDGANPFYNYHVPLTTPEKQVTYEDEIGKEELEWHNNHDFYSCRISSSIPRPVAASPIRPVPVNPALKTYPETEVPRFMVSKIPRSDSHGTPVPYVPRSGKPELSHPISRLCESAQPKEPTTMHALQTEAKEQEEASKTDKPTNVSDSNNNNSPSEAIDDPQRSRISSGQAEDLRCDQCGKTFVTRASLKVHTRTHSGEKPFRCADCGKQFSQLRNYKYHRSVHEGTREFAATCPECGKYFNDRGYLSSHMKIHRNRKEYACAECGKSFNQRVAYNMHVRIHTGVKPHQCEQCGKAFSRKMLLKQHLRTHSGERPYQCQVCHKAFADRSNMTLHTRLHSGLKPYQCTLCSKAFTKKHHLKTHLNYHTGTKPYSCPNCGLCFSQSSNMRTHYKKCTVNNPSINQTTPKRDLAASVPKSTAADLEAPKVQQLLTQSTTKTTLVAAVLTPPNSDQESNLTAPVTGRTVCHGLDEAEKTLC